jgi:hypothetical protein
MIEMLIAFPRVQPVDVAKEVFEDIDVVETVFEQEIVDTVEKIVVRQQPYEVIEYQDVVKYIDKPVYVKKPVYRKRPVYKEVPVVVEQIKEVIEPPSSPIPRVLPTALLAKVEQEMAVNFHSQDPASQYSIEPNRIGQGGFGTVFRWSTYVRSVRCFSTCLFSSLI